MVPYGVNTLNFQSGWPTYGTYYQATMPTGGWNIQYVTMDYMPNLIKTDTLQKIEGWDGDENPS